MSGNTIFATHQGTKSREILQGTSHFSVRGITSRGIFLAAEYWVIFLSSEAYRSPLTINIHDPLSGLTSLKNQVTYTDGKLVFEKNDLIIVTNNAKIYKTPLLSFNQSKSFPLSYPPISVTEAYALNEKTEAISHALKHKEWTAVTDIAKTMLGCGTGLTPEGDDFILGMVYALQTIPSFDSQKILQDIVHQAYQKTTTLSANLIECAAEGLVDERIYAALQALITNTDDQQTAIQNLLGWGNSSGKMVLAGMMTVLQAMAIGQ